MSLLRDADIEPAKRPVLKHIVRMLEEFGIWPVGEGAETRGETTVLADLGVEFVQGYLFARPAFARLAEPSFAG